MSPTQTQKTSTAKDTLAKHAAGLVAYTHVNPDFASYLFANLPKLTTATKEQLSVSPSPWLIPDSSYLAEKRLHWLLNEIAVRPKSQTALATTILAEHQHRTMPKNPIFGIVGLAIIGPTLGIISRRKKRKNKMRVLFTASKYNSLTKTELHNCANQVTMRLLSKELQLVGGNAYRLVPDTAEWLFTDQENEFATLENNEQLKSAQSFLQAEKLSHETLTQNGKITTLAISPAISEEIFDYLGATKISI